MKQKTRIILLALVLGIALFAPSDLTSIRAQQKGPLAVGVRVFQNPGNLPAALWYGDRCADGTFTKCGQPTPVAVDGYQGVKDKGTVYVNAANLTTAGLYTNIYLFALSEEAGEAGQAVFGEILKNIQFNTNVTESAQRKALRRDVRRREGIAAFSRALEAYRAKHNGQVPQLASGSYIRGVTFSTWPSWQATLGADLGAGLPVDPGKPDPADSSRTLRFVGCGGRHNPETCWDERAAEMRCPVQGYVFGYRALSATDAVIGTTYEYSGTHNWMSENTKLGQVWNGICAALTGDATADSDLDGVPSRIDNCPALANGNQKDTDRDGVGDACDACPLDDRNDVDRDTICANLDSCPFNANLGTDSDGDGIDDACDSQFCGNGVVNPPEECDPQGNVGVGAHQQCLPNCTLKNVTYCGDGQKQATNGEGVIEQCDGTDGVGPHQVCQNDCKLKTLTYCGDGHIQQPKNEEGQPEECDGTTEALRGRHQSCRSNCTIQQLTYCGDGALQNPNDEEKAEQCDTNDGVAAHQKCTNTCMLQTLTHCGDGTIQTPKNQEGVAEQCEGSGAETAQCTTTTGYTGTKTRSCTATSCQWGAYSACTTTQSCGDGVKNGPEQCDPNDPLKIGFSESQQQCTSLCVVEVVNVCGDGIIALPEECEGSGPTGKTCSELGWGVVGTVGCNPNSCRYYGGGCEDGQLSPGDVRIIFTFAPSGNSQLDVHLIIPTQGHIGYGLAGAASPHLSSNGNIFSSPFAWHSKTSGYGSSPIVTTFVQHSGAYYPGAYKYYIFEFGPDRFINSNAVVKVYTYKAGEPKNAELVKTYTMVAVSSSPTRRYWHVFDFDGGTITDQNVLQTTVP